MSTLAFTNELSIRNSGSSRIAKVKMFHSFRYVFLTAILFSISACPTNAAIVEFMGVFNSGNAGPLGTLPRNFRITFDYVEDTDGITFGSGTFRFAATPNSMVLNSTPQPEHT